MIHRLLFKRVMHLLLAGVLMLCVAACSKEAAVLSGATMGTTYSITVVDLKPADQKTLQAQVESVLAAVNSAMSTYQADSAISTFNQSAGTGWFDVPVQFAVVADAALQVAIESEGAFDPTVGPLVSRWGFGKDNQNNIPPSDEIAELMQNVGYSKVQVDLQKPALKKSQSDVRIDLNAIAKGYAVDLLAEQVAGLDYANYLVEIGGELRASGHNAKGDPWRIGIEQPTSDGTNSGLHLSAGGVATSGDYRNAFESDGVRYSHIIDPRTGYPVRHALASVTVVADSAMLADAWATALMVLGPDDGMKIADQYGLAGFFIVRDGPDSFASHASAAFEAHNLH